MKHRLAERILVGRVTPCAPGGQREPRWYPIASRKGRKGRKAEEKNGFSPIAFSGPSRPLRPLREKYLFPFPELRVSASAARTRVLRGEKLFSLFMSRAVNLAPRYA
jgi:hypothetical protein